MRQLAPVILAISLALALAGCETTGTGSVAGGECKIAHVPEYAVRGYTPYDQAWINRTEEALVTGCGQPRPLARPPELDKPSAKPPVKPAAKKPWWKRKPPPVG